CLTKRSRLFKSSAFLNHPTLIKRSSMGFVDHIESAFSSNDLVTLRSAKSASKRSSLSCSLEGNIFLEISHLTFHLISRNLFKSYFHFVHDCSLHFIKINNLNRLLILKIYWKRS